ncbi:MAG: hypothetical protein ACUVWJ_09730 [Spirochaetota bacterium]
MEDFIKASDRPKIGLFAGGIEKYWTEAGMYGLPALLEKSALELIVKNNK